MAAAEPLEPRRAETTLDLRDGRTLSVVAGRENELVEVRSREGNLEIRIRLTDEGPILELDSVRMALRASESVDVECGAFNVRADGDVRIEGDMIYLN